METKLRNEHPTTAPLALEKEASGTSFRRVLKNRSFVLLWLAQLLSQLGFNAANYGVIALVTALTHSTLLVGVAIISFTLPAVPFSLLAGVYVDSLDKRLVLWVSNLLRALATGLIVVALLWNAQALIPLFLLTCLISLVTQCFTPAETSAIPLLVGKHDLEPALSLFSITLTIAQVLGYLVLGGLLTSLLPPFHLALGVLHLQVQSYEVLFVLVSLLYGICTLLILAIPARAFGQKPGTSSQLLRSLGEQTGKIIRHDVQEIWASMRKNPPLLLALLQVSLVGIVLLTLGELAGPFVVTVLHLPSQDLPLVFAPAGLGLVLGGLLMPSLTQRLGKSRAITLGSLGTALGLLLIPLGRLAWTRLALPSSGFLVVVSAITFVIGLSLALVNIPAQTLLQEQAPEEGRGREFAIQSMIYNAGSLPVLLFAGAIADTLGIELVLYGLAAATLAFRWWVVWYGHRSVVS
jgi:Na+/melibiose symporter-like transporter